jgi:hypothetical protein
MNQTHREEALRLANALDADADLCAAENGNPDSYGIEWEAAKFLRRLAAEPEQDLVNHDAPIFGLETKFDPALTIQEGVKRMATAMGWRPPASDDPPAEQWKKPEPEPVAWTTLEELQNIRRDFTGSIWGRPKIHELGEVALYLSPPLRELSDEAHPSLWLIHFADQDVKPEMFDEENAAIERFKQLLGSWSCRLYATADRAILAAAREGEA